MLNRKFRKLNVLQMSVIPRSRFKKIPDNVKVGRWTQKDFQLIRTNMDSLVAVTRAKKNKDEFLKDIFSPSEVKLHMEKINIIGCFLGQGLTDLRLPCEVYHRANTLFIGDWGKKFIFTEEDDKTIINYMK